MKTFVLSRMATVLIRLDWERFAAFALFARDDRKIVPPEARGLEFVPC